MAVRQQRQLQASGSCSIDLVGSPPRFIVSRSVLCLPAPLSACLLALRLSVAVVQSFPFDKQFMQLLVESYWDSNQTSIVWAEPAKISQLIPDTMPDIVGCQCTDGQRQRNSSDSGSELRTNTKLPSPAQLVIV